MTTATAACPFQGAPWPPGNGDPGSAHEHPAGTPPCGTEPCGCPTGAHGNGEPGGFYVTAKAGSRTAWLLGPYGDHATALAHVDAGRLFARAADPRAHFYTYGTSRQVEGERRPGVLNERAMAWQASLIPAGTLVQYLKVGRGTVTAHNCTDPECTGRQSHQYAVAFETGRYRGTTENVWLVRGRDETTRPARKGAQR
jgi:hypothetical protein